MGDSTVICRCEEISVKEIELALQLGAESHDDIKRLTRCGMGPCQAKICRILVAEFIALKKGTEFSHITVPRLRVPLRPITLGVLAANVETGSAFISQIEETKDPKEG